MGHIIFNIESEIFLSNGTFFITQCLPIAFTLETMLYEIVHVWEKLGLARLPKLPADNAQIAGRDCQVWRG